MSAWLSADDLERLTGKKRAGAQRRALDRLGIRYIIAATGHALVRQDAVTDARGKARGPRWDRIAA